ncbi:MAG: NAD-dependent epimerase/dehydratase family protein [Chitinophagaceae bacterium]|nr:MAG: NAD-dependent epimerase/dehydratase family protein [Chitinophagaceae bacterium]
MIITIFGATGMVGKQLVREALIMGHHVKAFGRNVFTANFPSHNNLEIISGALFDEDQVFKAVQGSDAVISVVGGSIDGLDKTRSVGMKNIVKQMEKAGVKRIIALGGKGILDSGESLLMDEPDYPQEFLAVGKEHYTAYQILKDSDLDFTVIGSPDIIEGYPTGSFHTSPDAPPENDNNKIFSGDLSLFMLQELTKGDYIRKRVGISN